MNTSHHPFRCGRSTIIWCS